MKEAEPPKILIACPMGYKPIEGEPWFTGATWILSVLAQDYPRFRVFALAHNLEQWMIDRFYSNAFNNAHRMSKGVNAELVMRGIQTETPLDERGNRKKLFPGHQMFADLRNIVLEYAMNPENEPHEQVSDIESFDYLVSIDSDVMVHPDMVSRLVKIMEENPGIGLCSIPVNNTRRVGFDMEYPKAIFNFGHYRVKANTIEETSYSQAGATPQTGKFKINALIPVDYTGAACIIRMSMVEDHPEIRYGPHKNSEDAYFSYQIQKAGFTIAVDTSQVTLHMMDPRIYKDDLEMFNAKRIK